MGRVFLVGSKLLLLKGAKKKKKMKKMVNIQDHISCKLLSRFLSNFVCRVMYMEGIKNVNLIEIGPVVIEIRWVENG